MRQGQPETEFERLSWHDCHVWGLEFLVGDPDEGDWTGDLVLDIDYITEWMCGVDRAAQFRVAPAKLTFHGVTDPKLSIDWGSSGFQTSIHHVIINRITREQIRDQKVFLDRPYYRWLIELASPIAGRIEFGAVGFSQILLAEPVVRERQHLTLLERTQLTNR